jgi:endonuclease YncB( thermonuclease family)
LRHAISQARAASRVRVEKAVEQERVREAWEIGRLIDAHVLQHKERADYGMQVLERLAKDLGMDRSELYRMLEFYRAYSIVVPGRQLSWSHYKALIAVNDPGERKTLEDRAEKENWDRERLWEEVRALKGSGTTVPDPLLSQPGKPGTYRVIRAKAGPCAGELVIDLGFSNYVSLSSVGDPGLDSRFRGNDKTSKQSRADDTFKEGEIVAASQDSKGRYSLKNIPSPNPLPGGEDQGEGVSDLLYTYNAYVYEVLDGDTVNAVVDLGFGFMTTQALRLRGIDAPEIASADGMEAKHALEKMLNITDGGGRMAEGETGGPVLIKTVKSDKYDRYLADVYIDRRPQTEDQRQNNHAKESAAGSYRYVNQLLVDEGHAVVVEG